MASLLGEKNPPKLWWLYILAAFLSATGFTMIMAQDASLPFSQPLSALVLCLTIIIIFFLLFRRMIIFLLVLTLSVIIILLLFWLRYEWLQNLFSVFQNFSTWVLPFWQQGEPKDSLFEQILFLLFALIGCGLSYISFFFLKNLFLLLIPTLTAIVLLDNLFHRPLNYSGLFFLSLGCILFLVASARQHYYTETPTENSSRRGFYASIFLLLPFLLAGLLFTTSITPQVEKSNVKSAEVEKISEGILGFFHLPIPSLANRSPFNLGSMGYYPLANRLGGKVNQSPEAVMTVETSSNLLLRGATYNRYDKNLWSNTLFGESNRAATVLSQNQETDIFDRQRPSPSIPSEIREAVFAEGTIKVTPVAGKAVSSLFVPGHIESITLPTERLYFNSSGEYFSDLPLAAGESYEVSFLRFRSGSADFRNSLLALENYIKEHPEVADSQEKLNWISQNYSKANIPTSVSDYAAQIATSGQTPVEKAFLLQDALLGYLYNLEVETPPDEADFVEYFLLTREGYCTYFASAMTMLARAQGIPARYVEGFVVVKDPKSDPAAAVLVTGKEAHAWCEIYLDGIGWFPIDATPADADQSQRQTPEQVQITTTPTPVATNTAPTPTPIVKTIMPTKQPENMPTPTPVVAEKNSVFSLNFLWLSGMLLILLFLGIVFLLSLRAYRYKRGRGRLKLLAWDALQSTLAPEATLSYLERQTLRQLSILSINIYPAETMKDFALRLRQIAPDPNYFSAEFALPDISLLAELVEAWRYGGKPPETEALFLCYQQCQAFEQLLNSGFKRRWDYIRAVIQVK